MQTDIHYFYSSVYTCINNKNILYYWFLCKNKAIHYRFFIEHIRNADLQIVYRWPITLVLTGQLLIIHSIYHDDKKFNFLFKKVKRLYIVFLTGWQFDFYLFKLLNLISEGEGVACLTKKQYKVCRIRMRVCKHSEIQYLSLQKFLRNVE